jgi:alkylation response protein AidB-like acyl-CoA dehydrogenase
VELDLAVLTYSNLELKALLGQSRGALDRAQPSILKILVTDLHQRIDDLMVDVLGPAARYFRTERPLRSAGESVAGRDYIEPYMPTMLMNRGLSIEGGTHEVQRNLIARAVLE